MSCLGLCNGQGVELGFEAPSVKLHTACYIHDAGLLCAFVPQLYV